MIWLSEVKFVKVWNVEDKGNFVKAKLQTSEKKQDGSYENSDWFAAFVGGAAQMAKGLSNGDQITITKGKLSNVYNKDKKTSYLNMAVFDFEVTRSNDLSNNKPNGNFRAFDDDFANDFKHIEDDDDIPF